MRYPWLNVLKHLPKLPKVAVAFDMHMSRVIYYYYYRKCICKEVLTNNSVGNQPDIN